MAQTLSAPNRLGDGIDQASRTTTVPHDELPSEQSHGKIARSIGITQDALMRHSGGSLRGGDVVAFDTDTNRLTAVREGRVILSVTLSTSELAHADDVVANHNRSAMAVLAHSSSPKPTGGALHAYAGGLH